MSNTPLVSVIVPMYKVEEYLRECLDSVVNQTLKNLEILCVDDGSPDNSGAIAEEYAAKYPFVRVIHKENGGLSSARNAGLDAAAGTYVYFLDSDDYIEPETLEALSARAEKEQLDIVYFNTQMLFESRKVRSLNQNYIDYYTRRHSYDGVYTGQSLFAAMRENREFFPSVCLQLFRRSMIEENHIRFYHGILHEDNLFSFQTMILAQRAGYDSGSYYHRRMHGDSIMTAGKSIRNVEGYLVTYSEILSFMRGREVEEAAFDQISEFLYTSVWGNGRRIFQGLNITENDVSLTHGDFVAQHFLDMAKRSGETEFDRSRIKTDNDQLRTKLRRLERWTRLSILRYFFGGISHIREYGLMFTLRKAAGKVWRLSQRVDTTLCKIPPYKWLTAPIRSGISAWQASRQKGRRPLVSIILPVYNVEEFIEQGMDSLIGQTLKRIEIIAVDDGSTDRSLEILKGYAARDSRVKVFTQKNKFAGAARNLGLSHARGEYVIFLDSDDFFEPDLAREAYLAAKRHKADVVLFGARHFNHTTKEFKEAKWLLNNHLAPKRQPFNYRRCPDTLYRITTPAPWTKMFRREFVQGWNLQFQRIQNANDLFFTYSALAMAQRIVTVNKALVNYRVGLQTNLQTTKKKYPFCFYDAYKAWHDKLADLGALDTLRRSYVNVALSGCMHNLRSNKDLDVKRTVFDRLKEEILEALEIPGHPASYYDSAENYQDMLMILNGTFEDYLASTEKKDTAPRVFIPQKTGDAPVVSIVMPVCNGEKYLSQTLASIQNQSFEDFEVICVDCGSGDGSLELLNRTAALDKRFSVSQMETVSTGAARNFGFSQVRGQYTLFLDSDDLCHKDLLTKLLSAIAEQNADIAACNFGKRLPNGKDVPLTGVYENWIPGKKAVFSWRDCPDYILRVTSPRVYNKLYRSDFIREAGLRFEETSSVNDLSFAALSAAAADRIAWVADHLIHYQLLRPESTGLAREEKLKNVQTAVENTVRQAAGLPHGESLRNAILDFPVEQYVFYLKYEVTDFSAPDAAAFYQQAHETFNRAEFADVDAKTFHNPRLYRDFCTVRKHDYQTMQMLVSRRLIVSLTTYPRRIGTLHKVLETVYAQTRKADEVVLWLAPSQFPNKEADLPRELTQLVEAGKLTLRWCADLKPHKKYFYALQEYDNDLVVTVDDDLLYSETMLQSLYESYLLYPEAVSTVRAHLMLLENGKILPYNTWIQETDQCIHTPSMQLVATGGAGVLYPPKLFREEFFQEQTVMELCPWADDLWLKVMQAVSGVPVVVAREHEALQYLDGTQEEALHQVNVSQNQNDVQLEQTSRWVEEVFGSDVLIKALTSDAFGTPILGLEAVASHVDAERRALRRKVAPMEVKARQAEAQRKSVEQKLWQAEGALRKERETKPIRRQLEALGNDLHKQKQEKGKTPGILGKYFVYYTAWVPAKWLALHMYCLQNGLKQTVKKLLKRG